MNAKNLFTVRKIFFMVATAVLMAGPTMAGQMQKWVDENGNVSYGTNPPEGTKTKAVQSTVNSITGDVRTARRGSVVLYSTSWCGYCKKARAYMKKNGIAFRDYDIESDPIARAKYNRLGYTAVPVLVDGDDVVAGFTKVSYSRFFSQ